MDCLPMQKVIKLIKASLPLKLWHVSDPKLTKELMRHEDLKKREVRCYKIGRYFTQVSSLVYIHHKPF